MSPFEHGYLIAVANIINLHGETVVAKDVARELGVTWRQIARADLAEYDLVALKKIKEAFM